MLTISKTNITIRSAVIWGLIRSNQPINLVKAVLELKGFSPAMVASGISIMERRIRIMADDEYRTAQEVERATQKSK